MYKVIKGGCNARHPSSFKISRPEGLNHYIFLSIKTPAIFHIKNKSYTVSPDTGIIIPPKVPYSYQSKGGEYVDDWLHFSVEDNLLIDSIVKPGHFFPVLDGEMISEYIRLILWESGYNNSDNAADNINQLMRILLNHIGENYRNRKKDIRYSPYNTKLQNIRITMLGSLYNPISADECAAILGVSTNRFFHLYTEIFGISFKKDYIQMRIANAKNLLETTDLPVDSIAQICGYSSDIHFYRQFQKYVGQTPANYRKVFHNPSF